MINQPSATHTAHPCQLCHCAAYDTKTHRAFVASAEEGALKVLNLQNPAEPVRSGTIEVASKLFERCAAQSCFYENYDFGGGSAPCGYAPMVNIIFEKGDCSACETNTTDGACDPGDCVYDSNPSYNKGKLAVDASVATAEDAKRRAKPTVTASFGRGKMKSGRRATQISSAEPPHSLDGMHRSARCFPKAGFSGKTRDGKREVLVHGPRVRRLACIGKRTSHHPRAAPTAVASPRRSAVSRARRGIQATALARLPPAPTSMYCSRRAAYIRELEKRRTKIRLRLGHRRTQLAHVRPRLARRLGSQILRSVCGRVGQSVAVTTVPDYKNSIAAAAAPHKKNSANGELLIFPRRDLRIPRLRPCG